MRSSKDDRIHKEKGEGGSTLEGQHLIKTQLYYRIFDLRDRFFDLHSWQSYDIIIV